MMTATRLRATLVDLDGGADRAVVVTVERSGNVTVAPDPEPAERATHWVVPGFVDAHVHVSGMPADAAEQFVSSGVLAVRDLGGVVDVVRRWPGWGPRVVPFGGQLD